MKITVHRQACCSQDDQIGPLEAEFRIQSDTSFASLVQEIIHSGFLQFSSTNNRITGEVNGVGLVEVFSLDGAAPEQAVFATNPNAPAIELLGDGVLAFYFRHIRTAEWSNGSTPDHSLEKAQQSEAKQQVSFESEVAATAELLRIVDDEGRDDSFVRSIRSCLECLRANNIPGALSHFEWVCGVMRFDGWYPENPPNAALLDSAWAKWVRAMYPHVPRPRCACCGKLRHSGPCFECFGE